MVVRLGVDVWLVLSTLGLSHVDVGKAKLVLQATNLAEPVLTQGTEKEHIRV